MTNRLLENESPQNVTFDTRSDSAAKDPPLRLPRVSPYEAVRRHWFLALIPVLVLTAAGLFVAFARTPNYTAESTVAIGRLDVSQPGSLAGFADATEALAGRYSRAVESEAVTKRAAQKVGTSPAAVRGRLVASPFPESSVIRIQARTGSSESAVRLANAGSASLIEYVNDLNRSNPGGKRLFDQFKAASLELEEAQDALAEVEEGQLIDQTGDTPAERSAKADVDAAKLKVETLRMAYQTSQGGQGVTSLFQQLSLAHNARSDRLKFLQALGFAGFVGGVLAGIALAMLRMSAQMRRRLTASVR